MPLNLYRISQTVNTGYDTYSDAVVAANTSIEAARLHPNPDDSAGWADGIVNEWGYVDGRDSWAHSPADVTVQYIGIAADDISEGVICASFHAG